MKCPLLACSLVACLLMVGCGVIPGSSRASGPFPRLAPNRLAGYSSQRSFEKAVAADPFPNSNAVGPSVAPRK